MVISERLILGVLSHWANVCFCLKADVRLMSAFPSKRTLASVLFGANFKPLYFDYIDKVFMLRDHQME